MDDVSHTARHNAGLAPGRPQYDRHDNFQRIEVITGVARRRRWSSEEKARIVGESLLPGANVSEIARRHGVNPNQVFAWRRQFRSGDERTDASQEPGFAAVVVTETAPTVAAAKPGTIEVAVGRMVVRVDGPVDVATLHQVLETVRRLA